MSGNPLVVCDHGETRSGIPDGLRQRGVLVETQTLACGDYLVSAAFALERKAPRDLTDSLLSGKLLAQLDRVADSFEYGALLLEGDSWSGDRKLRSPLLGELYHWISLRPNLTVLYSPDATWSARLLLDLARREQLGRFTPPGTAAAPPRRPVRGPRDLLLGFPGVGQANADKLLARFGSVQRVAQATGEELSDALGPKRGRRLHDLLTRNDFESAAAERPA
jgi:ERCC4-type nuclease